MTTKRAKSLSADACPSCGTNMEKRHGPLKSLVNGESISVPGVEYLRCPSCGEVMFDLQAAAYLRTEGERRYRAKYGLLSAEEIRQLRRSVGLTQQKMSRMLRLGANTLSRWETGRNVQSAAMDLLLRMVQDVPGSVDYLKKRRA